MPQRKDEGKNITELWPKLWLDEREQLFVNMSCIARGENFKTTALSINQSTISRTSQDCFGLTSLHHLSN
jgi:hypothetical protein